MMSGPGHASPDADADAGAVGAVRELGADIVAAVDQDEITTRLSQLPMAALLGDLEAVLDAVASTAPDLHRRTSLWDRVLGRDLIAQAQPDPIANRVRLALSAAQTHASELAARIDALDALSSHVQRQTACLSDLVSQQRDARPASGVAIDPGLPAAAWLRRMAHLEAVVASWQAIVAQIALVRGQSDQLLDRHAQVRDLLVSLWRERTTAEAAAHLLDGDDTDRRAWLRRQLAALHKSIPSFPAQPRADIDRPQEPSP